MAVKTRQEVMATTVKTTNAETEILRENQRAQTSRAEEYLDKVATAIKMIDDDKTKPAIKAMLLEGPRNAEIVKKKDDISVEVQQL